MNNDPYPNIILDCSIFFKACFGLFVRKNYPNRNLDNFLQSLHLESTVYLSIGHQMLLVMPLDSVIPKFFEYYAFFHRFMRFVIFNFYHLRTVKPSHTYFYHRSASHQITHPRPSF
jgi:hypothetical protein